MHQKAQFSYVLTCNNQSRLTVVGHVAKKNAHAMTTEGLFTCSKMHKKTKNKTNLSDVPIISLFVSLLSFL